MSDDKRVTCGSHGETPATFVCQHIAGGVACGDHASADDPTDKWPDAWCDLCDEAYLAEGGAWNDESEKVASIKLMCTHCYEEARARNRSLPPHTRGAQCRLTTKEADILLHHAVHARQTALEASDARWGWKGMARWDFDHEALTLSFSDPARPTVIADVRLAGSYSTKSGTFQWAWATYEDEDDPAVRDVARLRFFGEVRGLEKLTKPYWACDELEGWEMAALAGYVLGADAIYRAPFDHQRWFMLLSNLQHSN